MSTGNGRQRGLRGSCEACRNRKVKCSGEKPACGRCSKMQHACVYLGRGENISPLSPLARSPHAPARGSSTTRMVENNESAHIVEEDHRRRRSLCNQGYQLDVAPNDRDLERRSRSPISSHVVPQFPYSSQLVQPLAAAPELLPSTTSQQSTPRVTLPLIDLPESDKATALIEHFEFYSNAAFPILHSPDLRRNVQKIYDSCPVSTGEACCVFLMFAVSIQSLSKRSALYDTIGIRPEALFAKAKDLMTEIYESPPCMLKLQIRLLHLQYTMYSPKQGNIWELSGSALRLAIDLGYHHERVGSSHCDRLEEDMRRRLFWSAYCIDRNLSIALGRPPGVPDNWINVQLYSELSDVEFSNQAVGHYEVTNSVEGSRHSKLSALHHVRVRQLQSEIQDRLYCLPRPQYASHWRSDPVDPEWFREMRSRIIQWRREAPSPTGFCSVLWLDLNMHITLTLLHRPSPRNPKPSKEDLIMARQGASGSMRTYKEMLKTGRINWGWLAMYQLFIAGIAYLNSLWQAAEQGWTIVPSYVDALLDVQVCTSVMASLSATTPGFTSLCSAFETLSERIIRQLTAKASWGQISRAPSPINHDLPANTLQGEYPGAVPDLASNAGFQSDTNLPWLSFGPSGDPADQWNVDLSAFATTALGNDFMIDMGIDLEPQATFDNLFLHPLPELPLDDWGP